MQDITETLDRALDAAESILRELLTGKEQVDPTALAAGFEQHVRTHLEEELANIADHGTKDDAI